MKSIVSLLLLFVLAFSDPLMIYNYESADLNNHGGPVIEERTDIVQIDMTDYYISFRGMDSTGNQVGESYTLSNYVQDGLNSSFIMNDSLRGFYIYNQKLIVVDLDHDKIMVYILK